MQRFEFKVVPAPRRGEKARGVKSSEDRFALALSTLMNQLGSEGWDYVRADALPCDERSGLTGTKTVFQNMLVFRRVIESPVIENPVIESPMIAGSAIESVGAGHVADTAAPRAPVFVRTSPVAEPDPQPVAAAVPVLKAEPGAALSNGNTAPALGPARPGVAAE